MSRCEGCNQTLHRDWRYTECQACIEDRRAAEAPIFADRWRCAWQCVGEAVNGDAALDEAVALAERFQDRLAEARAIIEALLPMAECWCEDGKGEDDGTMDRARAWLREGKE